MTSWYVLSAKHHLLDPDGSEIKPYDETLNTAGIDARRKWAETVYEQLHENGLTALIRHSSFTPGKILRRVAPVLRG